MAGIDEVLERLITDPDFKRELTTDPRAALRGYDLTAEDIRLLSQQVSDDAAAQSGVEQRTSKAGFFGLLAQFGDGGTERGIIINGTE